MRSPRCLFAAMLLLALVFVPTASFSQQPPSGVHLADGHWTAWNPPSNLPDDVETYAIQPGDTLWGLAEKFYGDPYLWPQLWERNRYIEDSHWIYPGDPLVVETAGMPMDQVASVENGPSQGMESEGATAAEGAMASGYRLDRRQGAPEPLGTEDDVHCSGFIARGEVEFDRRIIGSEYENLSPRLGVSRSQVKGQFGTVDTVKLSLSTGDIIYLDGGEAAGVFPGSVFTAVTPLEKVSHPVTGEGLGRFYKYSGRVRVLSVQAETAIAEIVQSCDPIMIGALLQPFVDEPIPLARRIAVRGVNDPQDQDLLESAPTIVRAMDRVVSLGQDHVVFIDRGTNNDVVPGDIFTIYRLNDPGLPAVVIGELGILTADAETATGKILQSRYSVHLGDRLDLETH